ncbi:MAG: ATP-binding cassette domain-containing protein, partial [Planctomycetales bacterium]
MNEKSASPPLLRMSEVAKRFGPTRALRGVSLELQAGETLALIGENGAGKSTLMKILSGADRPDSGSMELSGQPYAPKGPYQARQAGVAMIYQELNLAPDLNVEENVMLGQEIHRWGWISRSAQRRRVREALDLLGHPELQPGAPVAKLSLGAQQLVEIARGLVVQAKVFVL